MWSSGNSQKHKQRSFLHLAQSTNWNWSLLWYFKPRLHEQFLFDNFPWQIRLLVYMMQQICFDSTQKICFKSDAIIAQSLANVQINTCDKYVTVHGKTYVNDLSLKRKNERTTNEQRTNVPNVSTNYPNVPSIWSEKYERIKAKIHTIFETTLREYSNERCTVRAKLLCNASTNCNNYYKNHFIARMCMHLHSNFTRPLKLLIWIICLK